MLQNNNKKFSEVILLISLYGSDYVITWGNWLMESSIDTTFIVIVPLYSVDYRCTCCYRYEMEPMQFYTYIIAYKVWYNLPVLYCCLISERNPASAENQHSLVEPVSWINSVKKQMVLHWRSSSHRFKPNLLHRWEIYCNILLYQRSIAISFCNKIYFHKMLL